MLINAPTLRPLLAAPTQGVRVGCFTASASSSILVADSGDAVAGAIAQVLGGGLALFAGASFLLTAALALWFWNESYVLSLRKQRYKQPGALKIQSGNTAFVAPRDLWTASEIAELDGSGSNDGPILLAADGLVFNVAPGRRFYGPGGEYAIMAGKDASRYLARNSVEPESPTQAAKELNMAQRASLSAWLFSLKQRYDLVGRLATAEEEAAQAKRDAYYDRMEELSATYAARAQLEAAWRDEYGDESASEGNM